MGGDGLKIQNTSYLFLFFIFIFYMAFFKGLSPLGALKLFLNGD